MRLWDIDTGAELRRFEGHRDWVGAAAVLLDGYRALSASGDQTLRLWDIDTTSRRTQELCKPGQFTCTW